METVPEVKRAGGKFILELTEDQYIRMKAIIASHEKTRLKIQERQRSESAKKKLEEKKDGGNKKKVGRPALATFRLPDMVEAQ